MWKIAGSVLRKLAAVAGITVAASLLVFFLLEAAPGQPVDFLADPEASAEAAAARRALFGLDDSMPVRLQRWLQCTFTLDFGVSFVDHRPVREKILEAAPHTLLLSGVSLVAGFVGGIALALLCAFHAGRFVDSTLSAAAVFFTSIPLFWMATVATGLLAVEWGWFPAGGEISLDARLRPGWHVFDRLHHLALPALLLTIATAAGVARFARASLVETMRSEFFDAARARGATRGHALWRHALPASLHSTIALFGLSIPRLVGGSVILEQIFNYPGLGRLLVGSMIRRDYPVVCAAVIALSLVAMSGNALATAVARRLDPRLEGASREGVA